MAHAAAGASPPGAESSALQQHRAAATVLVLGECGGSRNPGHAIHLSDEGSESALAHADLDLSRVEGSGLQLVSELSPAYFLVWAANTPQLFWRLLSRSRLWGGARCRFSPGPREENMELGCGGRRVDLDGPPDRPRWRLQRNSERAIRDAVKPGVSAGRAGGIVD